jgi:hypothetical protein
VVLCDLEGKTREQAACLLDCPEGTVASRLARARTMLAKRLTRHGPAVTGATLAAILSEKAASAGVPASVMCSTIKAVTSVAAGQAVSAGAISATVAALAEGVVKAMLITKLKVGAAVLVGVVAFTCGMLAMAPTDSEHFVAKVPDRTEEKPRDADRETRDALTIRIEAYEKNVHVNEPFAVELRVVNSSQSPQTFRVFGANTDGQWLSKNERVAWESEAAGKSFGEMTVKLKPGEAYEKTMSMVLLTGESKEKVPFRIGFTPIDSKVTYLSNDVTVQVFEKKALYVAINPYYTRQIEVKKPFAVKVRVVNSSAVPQSFQFRNNAWDHRWKSSNENIGAAGFASLGLPDPFKVPEVTMTLKPGEAAEVHPMAMQLRAGKPGEKVSFKMGFTPGDSKETYWSNEITLPVKPEPKADNIEVSKSAWFIIPRYGWGHDFKTNIPLEKALKSVPSVEAEDQLFDMSFTDGRGGDGNVGGFNTLVTFDPAKADVGDVAKAVASLRVPDDQKQKLPAILAVFVVSPEPLSNSQWDRLWKALAAVKGVKVEESRGIIHRTKLEYGVVCIGIVLDERGGAKLDAITAAVTKSTGLPLQKR